MRKSSIASLAACIVFASVLPGFCGFVVLDMGNSGDMTKSVYDTNSNNVVDTATALAANGANCSAGQAPLGVDASGAVEGCWTPYANLTSFVDQTPFRVFYSDGSGDVKELPFGDNGSYIKSNGPSAAPTFDTPTGGSSGKNVTLSVVPFDSSLSTGDNQIVFTIPLELNGKSLSTVGAHIYTVSSSGLPTFMIHKKAIADDAVVDMLSTRITIDANERDSSTAETAAVIATDGNQTVATGDEVWIDVDVAGTGTKGSEVRMYFE